MRIVVVTATPVPAAPIVVVVEPTMTSTLESAEFSFPVTQPTQVPLAAAPIEAEPEPPSPPPVPETLRDQLGRCVTFRTERFNAGYFTPFSVFTQVRATNICDTSFSGRDVWVEVRAFHVAGKSGVAGSKITRFQGLSQEGRYTAEIPARGSADLLVQIDGLDQSPIYRFETTLSSREDERERGD